MHTKVRASGRPTGQLTCKGACACACACACGATQPRTYRERAAAGVEGGGLGQRVLGHSGEAPGPPARAPHHHRHRARAAASAATPPATSGQVRPGQVRSGQVRSAALPPPVSGRGGGGSRSGRAAGGVPGQGGGVPGHARRGHGAGRQRAAELGTQPRRAARARHLPPRGTPRSVPTPRPARLRQARPGQARPPRPLTHQVQALLRALLPPQGRHDDAAARGGRVEPRCLPQPRRQRRARHHEGRGRAGGAGEVVRGGAWGGPGRGARVRRGQRQGQRQRRRRGDRQVGEYHGARPDTRPQR
jgi:hypothetical protein